MAKKASRPVARAATRPLTVHPSLPAGGRVFAGGLISTFAGNPERAERGNDRQNPNFDADGRKHDEGDRKPRYEVELLVRTFFGDLGVRPTTDPNLVFWESPDIWIDGPSGDPDQATPGVTNTVNVHVWNVGLADCWAAHVDLYWCDPSVGVTPALAHPIGSTVVTLMGGEHKIVPFPWVPTLANGGHECLVAQVYSPVSDPLVAPFSPTLDRHVCQRNISVVTAAAGTTFQLLVSVPNLSNAMATSSLEAGLVVGSARRQFFRTIGAPEAPLLGRGAVPTLSTRSIRLAQGNDQGRLVAASFREALDPLPARSTTRVVAGSLRALAAPRARGRRPSSAANITLREIAAPAAARPGPDESTTTLALTPGTVTQVAINGRLPKAVAASGRDVYRIVERVGGRITGGVTVIVKPAAAADRPAARRRVAATRKTRRK